jgi:hypothetical protein
MTRCRIQTLNAARIAANGTVSQPGGVVGVDDVQVPRFFLSPVGYAGAAFAALSYTLALISTAVESETFWYVLITNLY